MCGGIVGCTTPRARGDGDGARDDDQSDPDKLARCRPMTKPASTAGLGRAAGRESSCPRAAWSPTSGVTAATSTRPSAPTTRATTAS